LNIFETNLYKMYEYEYKQQAIKNWKFDGLPSRYENIQKNIQDELITSTVYVKNILLQILDQWLNEHTYDPYTWGLQRIKNMNCTNNLEIFYNIIKDYYNHKIIIDNQNQKIDIDRINFRYFDRNKDGQLFIEVMQIMIKNYDDCPTFKQLINLENKIIFQSPIDFIQNVSSNPAIVLTLLIEIYGKVVFPLWKHIWGTETILKIKENIQNIYNNLNTTDLKDYGNMFSWTNVALNSTHRTGKMLKRVENITNTTNLKNFLDDLTNGKDINNWNKDLNEKGFYLSKT